MMSNNELLLSISNIMDEKLRPIKEEITSIKQEITGINKEITGINKEITGIKVDLADLREHVDEGFAKIHLILENEIRPGLKILAENYPSSFRDYNEKMHLIDELEESVKLLNITVTEHSQQIQKLQKIS